MIYTFYSFKGGVGRSMAMAAVAYLFAQRGLKVLVIDFDLEAPGLERYFFESDQARILRQHLGLIDLLTTYKKAMTSEAEFSEGRFRRWWDFVDEAVPSAAGGGKVDIMTAGQREPEDKLRDYALAVRTFDWQDFFANWNGEKFFDWLRKQLVGPPEGAEHPGYDVVLVDSRTGVTEMGGVSAYQLADCAVMLCAANYQNLDGTLAVARDFRSDPVLALRRGRPLELLVIPARLEGSHPKRGEFLAQFAAVFQPAEYFPPALKDAGLDYAALALPYEPEFAVIERLVGDAEGAERETARQAVGSFQRLADALTLLAGGRPGQLAAKAGEARERLRGGEPAGAEILEQVADPTQRTAGFDVYLDAPRADQGLAARLAAELKERGLRVLYAEEPNLLALGLCETLVLCFGESGSSEAANRLVAGIRERKSGAPAIVPLLLAAEAEPCPSGRAAARALELESQLVFLDPEREGWVDRLLAAIRKARPTTLAKAPDLARDPYPGERAFNEDDAALFFGRDKEIAVLVEKTEKNRITWLIGAAGVGKSSLVGAGLVPRWRQQLAARPAEILVIDCAADEPAVWQQLAATPRSGARRIVLDHVDSFPLGGGREAQDARLKAIAEIAAIAARGAEDRLVLVCRDVFELEERTRLFQVARPDATVWLDGLSPEDLQQAIERPVGRAGHIFEQGLVQLLVENAGKGSSAVAQVQRVLPKLWHERKRGWLTTTAYNQAGGVAGTFEKSLGEFRSGLPEAEQKALDTLLRTLVYYDRNLRLLSDVTDWSELASIPDLAAVDAVALRDRLADRNLIELHRGSPSTSEGERTRVGLVFATPESYGKVVELVPDPGFALWRRRFASQVQGWQQNGKSADFLLKGAALFEAQVQAQKYSDLLTLSESRLIEASVDQRKLEEQEARDAELARRETEGLQKAKKDALAERDRAIAAQERAELERSRAEEEKFRADAAARRAIEAASRARRFLIFLVALAALLGLAVALLVWSRRGLEESRSATQLAASDAVIRAWADKDPTAAALAYEILARDPRTPDFVRTARFAMLDSVMTWRQLWQESSVVKVTFSPDGKMVATGGEDGKVRLWNAEGRMLQIIGAHSGLITALQFSRDGGRILTASTDRTTRVFGIDGRQLNALPAQASTVYRAFFTAGDREILTVASDGARIWPVDSKSPVRSFGTNLADATLSQDGLIVVTTSQEGVVQIWKAADSWPVTLPVTASPVSAVSISRNSDLSLIDDRSRLHIFDPNGREVDDFNVIDGVRTAQWSTDGKEILVGTEDGSVSLLSRRSNVLSIKVLGRLSAIRSANFSPNEQQVLAIADGGNTALIFGRSGEPPTELKGHLNPIEEAVFSDDGAMVATAATDGSVRLWRLDGRPTRVLRGHEARLNWIAFSPDSRRLATTSADQTARLWSIDGQPLATLSHPADVMAVEFSPDAHSIATTSADRTTRIWSEKGNQLALIGNPTGSSEELFVPQFSPDGRKVLTFDFGSSPATPTLVDLTGHTLARLPAFPTNFWGNFSPDGEKIVLQADDGARLFSIDGTMLTALPGDSARVWMARFSPDGQKVATSCDDGHIRIFRLDGTHEGEFQEDSKAGAALYFEWEPNGKKLLVTFARSASLVVAPDGKFLSTLEGEFPRPQSLARFNPDGSLIAASNENESRISLWNIDGRLLGELLGHHSAIRFFDLSRDGNYLASASYDTTARIWPISEAAFTTRLREIAKPCLNEREWRIFFPFDDEATARKKVEECEGRAASAPAQ